MISFEHLTHGSIVKLLKDFDNTPKGAFYKLPMVGFRPLVAAVNYETELIEELEIEDIEAIPIDVRILEKLGFKSFGEGYRLEENWDRVLTVEFTEIGLKWTYFNGFVDVQLRRRISTIDEFQLFYIGFFGIDFVLYPKDIE